MGFVYRAEGAGPVGGQVFKFGSGGDAVVGVADCGVIDIPANIAFVFFHVVILFFYGVNNSFLFIRLILPV
jgi:hypothetical protein